MSNTEKELAKGDHIEAVHKDGLVGHFVESEGEARGDEGRREGQGNQDGDEGGNSSERSARPRVPTVKGKEYIIEQCKRRHVSTVNAWNRFRVSFKERLTDISTAQQLKTLREDELNTFTEYNDACNKLINEDPEYNHDLTEKFLENESIHFRYVEQIKRIEESLECELKSVSSHVSKGSRFSKQISVSSQQSKQSSVSRRSKVSKGSRTSSTSSSQRKHDAAAKIAKLKVDLEYHDSLLEAKQRAGEAEARLRKLQRTKELAAAQAEHDVLDKAEDEVDLTVMDENEKEGKQHHLQRYLDSQSDLLLQPLQQTHISHEDKVPHYNMNVHNHSKLSSKDASSDLLKMKEGPELPVMCLNPTARAFIPESEAHKPNAGMYSNNVGQYCQPYPDPPMNAQRSATMQPTTVFLPPRNSLPQPEPQVFKGDLMHFITWLKNFEIFVESRNNNPVDRLFYLGKYTAGEAREAIDGMLLLNTEKAYYDAKETLNNRFGNVYLISNAYRTKLNNWPKIHKHDGPALRKFSDFLQSCKAAMKSVPHLSILDDAEENQKLLKKLPISLTKKWNITVHGYMYEKHEGSSRMTGLYPPFERFCEFIQLHADIECNPISSYSALAGKGERTTLTNDRTRNYKSSNVSHKSRSFLTEISEAKSDSLQASKPNPGTAIKQATKGQEEKKLYCRYCKVEQEHDLDSCKEFMKLTYDERYAYVQKHSLCRGCLRFGHTNKECKCRRRCRTCQKRHPTSLHNDAFVQNAVNPNNVPSEPPVVTHKIKVKQSVTGDIHTLIVPVWLRHEERKEEKVLVYALLDNQSDSCFVTQGALDRLRVRGQSVHLKVSTITRDETIPCEKVSGLVVQGINENVCIELPHAYSRDRISAKRSQIPRPETARRWPHLQSIASEIMPYRSDIEVGLLIGVNCNEAIEEKETISGKFGDPTGKRTALGWGIQGRVTADQCSEDTSSILTVHRTIAQEVEINNEKSVSFLVVPTKTKEIINPMQVKQMFELDFSERMSDDVSMSLEDKRFLDTMERGIQQLQDGHYQLPLPLKDSKIRLHNNRALALHRLMKLRRRFQGDKDYLCDYQKFMHDLICKGYAEVIPNTRQDSVWYIPHHGVYHPKKPGKIRVVFDCSAKYKNQSLNSQLLQGPNLTNNLSGVLCRFRQEQVAFVCDIEAMYHQVKVNPEHRDLLRFLWWKDGDPQQEILEYRMTVHLFGATSSPSAANFALKAVADDYENKYGQEAANFVREEFYVDDGLKSVPTVQEAIKLFQDSRALCKRGGFNLHKILSNSKQVLAAINPDEMSSTIKNLDLCKDTLPIERTLGIEWCIESDTFQFRVHLKDKPLTRRGILSTVSSIYDPLGLVSPFILIGKGILQELCKEGVSWDDEISDQVRAKWEQWRVELHDLHKVKIPRCYKPATFGEVKKVELHHFSDASQDGYGQCSYIRLINNDDQIHCALVMAKSRVTPLKTVTVPRLELQAAVVSVKIHGILKKELRYQNRQEMFWTDSKVVLGYICNDSKRFHVYVANRVQQIRDQTSPSQWRYVDTKNNPADCASRGLYVKDLIDNTKWWNGPEFLWKELDMNDVTHCPDLNDDDPEVKRVTLCSQKVHESVDLLDRLSYFSDWFHARRAVAVCLKLQGKFRKSANVKNGIDSKGTKERGYSPVSSKEIKEAEIEIIKMVQDLAFPEEIQTLMQVKDNKTNVPSTRSKGKGAKVIKKASRLSKLDPYMDDNGIIRVGGRIRQADLHPDTLHPVILPKESHITNLVICYYHTKIHHQGRGITLNEIRSNGYWILGGSSMVARHVSKCVVCRRVRSNTREQKMSDLPKDRLEPAPPFTYSSVDFFGPFFVKEGRKEHKRYGVLFTCMASRAIHIEIANSMDTSSFINAYRRFIGRRGPVTQLRSDQGTNFVGARNELHECLRQMDQNKIRQELLKESCDWVEFKMNVPHASHMGGVWERQIRTVRNVLSVLLDQHRSHLDDETLRTFLVEAESVVNGRPLTVDDLTSPDSLSPLTPNTLLTMKTKLVLPPPGKFESADKYSKKRWRRVQFLANEFWTRWNKEYLQSLQPRSKWLRPQRNIKVDDIVIVKDNTLARNHWKLGRITEALPDTDGFVRKVKVMLSDSGLDSQGKRIRAVEIFERPIHSLVLLLEA